MYISAHGYEQEQERVNHLEEEKKQRQSDSKNRLSAKDERKIDKDITKHRDRQNTYTTICEKVHSSIPAWKGWDGPQSTAHERSFSVKRLSEWLLDEQSKNRLRDVDLYFRDRDGQCLMHYIGKDKHREEFQVMTEKGFSPLVRGRDGRTAWQTAKPRPCPRCTIGRYVCQAYNLIHDPIISIIELQEDIEPAENLKLMPKQFLSPEGNPPLPSSRDDASNKVLQCLRGDKTIWINLGVNDVSTSFVFMQ